MKKIYVSLFLTTMLVINAMAETPSNLYILGNIQGVGWEPGASAEMTKNGDVFTGTYTFTEALSYFCFATVQGGWDDVNANRYGTTAQINPGTDADLTKGGDGTCATIAAGTYVITVNWATQKVSAESTTPPAKPDCPAQLNMLGNIQNVGWEPTAVMAMTKNDSIFTATATFVADGTNEVCYFCFTSASGSWDDINAARYGSAAQIMPGEAGVALTYPGEKTATIAPGTYTITVDWRTMTVSAASPGTGMKEVKAANDGVRKVIENGHVVLYRNGVRMSVLGSAF